MKGYDFKLLDQSAGEIVDTAVRTGARVAGPIPLPSSRTLEEIEREAIVSALLETDGNKTQAARMLGIGLRTLHRKVKEYGIS